METLHKDLTSHAFNGMVHHPLMVAPLTKDASHINRTYRHKIEAVAKAKANALVRSPFLRIESQ